MTTTKNAPLYSVVGPDDERRVFGNGMHTTTDRGEARARAKLTKGCRVVATYPSRLAELEAANARADDANALREAAEVRAARLGAALGYAVLDLDVIGHGPGGIDAQAVVEAVARGENAVPRLSAADHADAQRWRSVIATLPLSEEALGRAAWGARPEDHNRVVWEMADDELRDMYTCDGAAVARAVMAALASDVAMKAAGDAAANAPTAEEDCWCEPCREVRQRAAFAAHCAAAVGVHVESMPGEAGEVSRVKAAFAEDIKRLTADLTAERARANGAERALTRMEEDRDQISLLAIQRRDQLIASHRNRSAEIQRHTEKRAALADKLRVLEARVNGAEARGAARLKAGLMTPAARKAARDVWPGDTPFDEALTIALSAALRVAEGEGAAPVAPADPAPARTPLVEVGQKWKWRERGAAVCIAGQRADGWWTAFDVDGTPYSVPHDAAGWTRVDATAEAAPRWADDLADLTNQSEGRRSANASDRYARLARAIVELRNLVRP